MRTIGIKIRYFLATFQNEIGFMENIIGRINAKHLNKNYF